jgi:hypothetical protein
VAGSLTAAGVKDFAGHEGGRFEVEGRADDVRDLAIWPTECRAAICAYVSNECIGVLMTRAANAFTRILRFVYSIASDLVTARRGGADEG